MKPIKATLTHEKDAPKTRVFGVLTKDGVLIKVWIPKGLIKSSAQLAVTLATTSGKKVKDEEEDIDEDEIDEDEEDDEDEDVDDDEDVDEEDEDEDEDEDDEDDSEDEDEEDEPPVKKRVGKKSASKKRR